MAKDNKIKFVVAFECPNDAAFKAIWRDNLANLMREPASDGTRVYAVSMIDLFQQIELIEALADANLDILDFQEAIGEVLEAVDPAAAAQPWLDAAK